MKLFQTLILFVFFQQLLSSNDTTAANNTGTSRKVFQTFEVFKKWMNFTNEDIQRRDNVGAIFDKHKKKGKQAGHFYEPYWEGGEKVFLRTTKAQDKWKPKQHYKKEIVTTSAKPTPPYRGDEMGINRDCYRDCINLYSYDFGRVCGYRYNTHTWKVEFMEFENMCTLEQENCKVNTLMWVAIHRGICPELTTFKSYPTDPKGLLDRADKFQVNVELEIENAAKKHKKGRT